MSPSPALILDITRFLSRADGVLTGVDRVEFAYLRHLSDLPTPAFALARTTLGYLLLDRKGMAELVAAFDADVWPSADWLSLWNTSLGPGQKRVRSLARANAIGRCPKWGLSKMLLRFQLSGAHYLNVGHTNLGDRTLAPIKAIGCRVSILVHDVIPLDFPQFQRPETVKQFREKLGQVSLYADRVICLTIATQTAIRERLALTGKVPQMVVAPLGVELATPVAMSLADLGLENEPYLITVGTIEPRKNHALLLDIWEKNQGSLPLLLICGGRGWRNDEVFRRLDAGVVGVREVSGLTDGQLASLIAGSAGMLFPSKAEGFGLPPLEAAGRGVPVIASDLPALRENLGSYATYLHPDNQEDWTTAIRNLALTPDQPKAIALPDWNFHFKVALSMTC